jgi:hypothetical protein
VLSSVDSLGFFYCIYPAAKHARPRPIQPTLSTDAPPPVLALDEAAAPAEEEAALPPVGSAVPLSSVLGGAAPVSLAVPVVATAPVLPADRPAVIVTGKYVISLGARVLVLSPGKFAAEPAYDSMHTPAVVPVKVQSTDMVKSCTSWSEQVSHWIHSKDEHHEPGSGASCLLLQ